MWRGCKESEETSSQNLLKAPHKPLKMKVHFPCATKKGEQIAQAALEEQSVIRVAHILPKYIN